MEEEKREDRGESEKEVEEAVRARAGRTEAAPSAREVEEHDLDHAVFRSWCPHYLKGRGEAYRHVKNREKEEEKGAPVVGVDYA